MIEPSDALRAQQLARRGLVVAVAVLAAAFVAANRSEIPDAWRELRHAHTGWLALALLSTAALLVAHGLLHAVAQRAAGLHLPLRRALSLAVGASFLNTVSKSGGMAGVTLFVADARRSGRSRGQTLAGYVLVAVLADLSFAVTLAAALVVMVLDGHVTRDEVLASMAFAVVVGVRLTLVLAAVRSRDAVRWLHALPGRLWAALRRRPPPAELDTTAADELFDAMALLRRHPAAMAPAFGLAVLLEVLGIAVLASVLLSVHGASGLVAATVAYAIGVLFAIIGFLPGGLGFVEVSVGAVLVSFGSTVPQASAAVALYRIFELWIPLTVGAVAARAEHRR